MTTIILASDYAAVMDGHSQDQESNYTATFVAVGLLFSLWDGIEDISLFILASTRYN